MKAFTTLNGLVCRWIAPMWTPTPLSPSNFLKSIKRSGFGPNLFDEWRYLDHGEPGMDNSTRPVNPDFVLNFPRYQGAQMLLARENFGCGSSREHAPWALEDQGLRVVIARRLPIFSLATATKRPAAGVQPAEVVDQLFKECVASEGYRLTVDLAAQTVTTPSGQSFAFDITPHRKHCMLNGLDEIGLTLAHADKIRAFEDARKQSLPWFYV